MGRKSGGTAGLCGWTGVLRASLIDYGVNIIANRFIWELQLTVASLFIDICVYMFILTG